MTKKFAEDLVQDANWAAFLRAFAAWVLKGEDAQ